MRSPQEDIELLDQYIKGTLSTPEIQVLKLRLSQEQDLKNDLEALKALRQGMRAKALEEKMRMMSGWEDELVSSEINTTKTISETKIFTLKKFMVAAGVVLLLGVGWWWMNQSLKKVHNSNYAILKDEQFENELILHSTKRAIKQDVTLSADQKKAYQLYGLKLFEDASPLLLKLWITKYDTLALFYHGVCEMGLGHEKAGRQIFNKSELARYQAQIRMFDKKE